MTERTLDSDLQEAAESPVFPYAVFVKLAFPSGTVYLHNALGSHEFDGNTYEGIGSFGSIEAFNETSDLVSNPIKLVLSSIVPEIIDAVLTDNVYGRDADIYLGKVEDNILKGTPTNWLSGYMEKVELAIGPESGVAVTVQSRAAKLKKINNKRYTLEDHQRDYPGDLFFEFLFSLIDAKAQWAGGHVQTGTPGTGGRTRRDLKNK